MQKINIIRKEEKSDEKIESEINRLNKIYYVGKKEQSEADLSHLTKCDSKLVNELITNYVPTRTHECPVEMEIILTDEIPVSIKPRRLPFSKKQEVEQQIKQWFEDDVTQNSYSDFAAPVVVPKKDGSKRLYV